MVKNQQIPAKKNAISINTPSALERFTLGFEYNKTLQEIRREVRIRTI